MKAFMILAALVTLSWAGVAISQSPGQGNLDEEALKARALQTRNHVKTAIQDLSARLDISAQAIRVVVVEYRNWPDEGPGCTEPGAHDSKSPISGRLIVLAAEEAEYEYLAAEGQEPLYCKEVSPAPEAD